MDDSSGIVTGYIVIRKKLTLTLKEYIIKSPNLSPILKAYLRKQIEDKLKHLHNTLNVYQDPS